MNDVVNGAIVIIVTIVFVFAFFVKSFKNSAGMYVVVFFLVGVVMKLNLASVHFTEHCLLKAR